MHVQMVKSVCVVGWGAGGAGGGWESCLVLFSSSVLVLLGRLQRLRKRELILVLFVRLFDLRLFGFVCFLFILVSGMGCGL